MLQCIDRRSDDVVVLALALASISPGLPWIGRISRCFGIRCIGMDDKKSWELFANALMGFQD